MTNVYIIRHGAADEDNGLGNLYSPNAGLSDLGELQADELVQECERRGIVFDAIFSSPLPRAVRTARKLPSMMRDIFMVDGLREPDWGELVGKPFADFPPQTNGRGYDLYALAAGQEPFVDVVARARGAFSAIFDRIMSGEDIAIVSHGLISKIGMSMLRGSDLGHIEQSEAEFPADDQLGNAQGQHFVLDDHWEVVDEERIGDHQ